MCVCFLAIHSGHQVDVPAAGVTQKEGRTGFFIHLLSAVRASVFLARRIQPFLSLVDREVAFCVLLTISFSTRWAFFFLFLFREKNPVIPGSFLSLVDREVAFCVLLTISFSTRWAFFFLFLFREKNPVIPGSNSRPNVSEGYEATVLLLFI